MPSLRKEFEEIAEMATTMARKRGITEKDIEEEIDTNVLISAFISEGSCREIFRAVLQGKIALITSEMASILKRASKLITPRQALNVIKEREF